MSSTLKSIINTNKKYLFVNLQTESVPKSNPWFEFKPKVVPIPKTDEISYVNKNQTDCTLKINFPKLNISEKDKYYGIIAILT